MSFTTCREEVAGLGLASEAASVADTVTRCGVGSAGCWRFCLGKYRNPSLYTVTWALLPAKNDSDWYQMRQGDHDDAREITAV